MSEIIGRIEKNVDQLFSKVNDLGMGQVGISAQLKGIVCEIKKLPCKDHSEKIATIDKEVYANNVVRTRVIGGLGILGTILGIIAIGIGLLKLF